MTQNSIINAMLSNPRMPEVTQKSTAKGFKKNEDTFMDLLSERMQNRNGTEKAKERPLKRPDSFSEKDPLVATNQKSVIKNSTELKETVIPNKAQAQGTSDVKTTKDSPKENSLEQEVKEETINTFETMVTLLEELLARLDVKTITADPVEITTQPELISANSEATSPMELLKLLLEGNIEKLKAILSKTPESQQNQEFNSLLENVQKLLEKVAERQEDSKSILDLNLGVSEGASKEDLINQLKAQCGEVVEKLNERIAEFNKSQPKDQKSEGEALDPVQLLSEESVESQPGEQPKAEISNDDAKKEPKAEKTENKPMKAHQVNEPAESKTVLNNKDCLKEDFVIPTGQKPQETDGVKVEKTLVPLSEAPLKQTVTNQVMMKVKLMAGENKQEMEMHLKPESLGKLSLRIIHERGEILAKITAENEQVKGIIESNMQLLKDALEKSGFSVLSLSVSVGNGNEKNQTKQGYDETSRSTRGVSDGFKKSIRSTDTLYAQSSTIRNFFGQDSQIDLTA